MSMTVAIRPASLWTHVMLTALSELEKSGLRRVDLSKVEFGELRGEFRRWISTSSTSHEGPVAKGPPLYGGSRRRRYGRIFHRVGGRSQRGGSTVSCGGRLPEDWLTRHINSKESSRCITSYSSSAPDTPTLYGWR